MDKVGIILIGTEGIYYSFLIFNIKVAINNKTYILIYFKNN